MAPKSKQQSTALVSLNREPSPELLERSSAFIEWLDTERLTSAAERSTAEATLVAVKALQAAAEAEKESVYRPIKTALDTWSKKCKAIIDPLNRVEAHLKGLIVHFDAEARAKLEAAAEKKAVKLEKAGQTQAAEDVREMALATPVVANSIISYTTLKFARVADKMAFFNACAMGVVPDAVIEDMLAGAQAKLNGLVKSGLTIPGVVLDEKKVPRVG